MEEGLSLPLDAGARSKPRGSRRWCGRALDPPALGELLGRPVSSVEVIEDRSGTTRRTRARLGLADGNTLAVFIKRPSRSFAARAFVAVPRLSHAEVAFYTELQPQVPVATPTCRGARHRRWGFTVVLDDLVDTGATLRSSTDAITPDEAQALLGELADMHRRWWGRTGSHRWLARNPRRELLLGTLLSPTLCRLGLRRAADAVPPSLRPAIARYARRRRAAHAAMGAGPATLIHNDCHPGNQFVTADGRPGLIDWQLCRAGPWARDVAYLLATSLAPEDRRSAEQDLLADYLVRLGPEGPASEEAWLAYRRHVAYAVEAMLVTTAVGVMMPAATSQALLARACVAADDLDTFGAL